MRNKEVRPLLTRLPVLLTLAFLASSCATVTGPPVSGQEINARRSELEAKAERFKATQQSRVAGIAQRVIQFMPTEDQARVQRIQFTISDSQDVNATASPGKLEVTYGMLRFIDSDDELAVVVGHELAHLAKGHIAKSMATNVAASVAGVAIGAAIDSLTGGGGLGDVVAEGVGKGVSAQFSRDFEREADYYGFQYVYLSGFDILKGAGIWERFAIELPKSMSMGLFSTHPSSPERVLRAEKIIQELDLQGISPHPFKIAGPLTTHSQNTLLRKTMTLPPRVVSAPITTLGTAVHGGLSVLPSGDGSSSGNTSPSEQTSEENPPGEAQMELETLRAEVARLKQAEAERKTEDIGTLRKRALEEEDLSRALMEAKEASKQLRYSEFGIQDMGLAKKVTNLWLGKSVSGEQFIFSINQKSVDWFVQYNEYSKNSWKALALKRRKYRAYWYGSNGRLYSEQDFIQSTTRNDFAKTTLQWDPELGDFLRGQWLLRIFEDGKLLDERTFEVV